MTASELTNGRELRALQVGEAFERGHFTGLGSLYTRTQTKGREFLRVGKLPRTCPTLMVMTELQEFLTYVPYLYTRWKLEQEPGFNCACSRNCMISRLHTGAVQSRDCVNLVHNLKIGTPFPDSENAQRNLKIVIVQIPIWIAQNM